MSIQSILFGTDGHLRSGYRFAIFVAAFLFIYIAATTVVYLIFMPYGLIPFFVADGIVGTALAVIVGYVCTRYLEYLPFSALGAWYGKRWIVNFAYGMALGIGTFTLAAVIGIALGSLRFSYNSEAAFGSILNTLALSFLVFFVRAAFEEAIFRGYILQTFVRSGLTTFAIVLTSVLFASLHNTNPSATWMSWMNTFIAGVWFGIAYLKTRELWFPFGLHLAWNWAQGSIFGIEVSGLTEIVPAPLMREIDLGPAWITGGDYGLEGGILTTIALVVSTLVIWYLPLKRVSGSDTSPSQ